MLSSRFLSYSNKRKFSRNDHSLLLVVILGHSLSLADHLLRLVVLLFVTRCITRLFFFYTINWNQLLNVFLNVLTVLNNIEFWLSCSNSVSIKVTSRCLSGIFSACLKAQNFINMTLPFTSFDYLRYCATFTPSYASTKAGRETDILYFVLQTQIGFQSIFSYSRWKDIM